MPIPTPNSGESRDDFMDRCMSNDTMVDEYPDTDQRFAICNTSWEENKEYDNMDKKIYKPFHITIKEVDDETREIIAVGSQEKVDRVGDVVKVDGIDFKNYKKNPVVLWAHNSGEPPIGKATKVWRDGKNLMFKIQYASADEYPFADTIYKLTKGGYINAYSIGFIPDFKEAEYNEKNGGYVFNKSELLEISSVPVPANPHALIQSKDIQKALKDKVINSIELEEFEKYLDEFIDVEDVEEENETSDLEQKQEQIIETRKCAECGHDLICPVCNSIDQTEKSSDDLFDWIFKEVETPKSKSNPHEEIIDELLQNFNTNEE